MKKSICILLSIIFILASVPMHVFCYTSQYAFIFSCDTLTGEATLTKAANTSISGEISIPPTYQGYPVTSIAYDAFKNCTKITEVIIPEGVATIGEDAFSGCTSLEAITLPSSLTEIQRSAFSNCRKLKAVTLPQNVTVHSYIFLNCDALSSVTISASLKYDRNATGIFSYCDSLKTVTFENGCTTLCPDMFEECANLTTVNLPDTVTTIGTGAFISCTSLSGITLPSSVTTIEDIAFSESGLKTIVIPEKVTTITSGLFKNCTSLTTVTLPDTVTTIGTGAFNGCTNLESINFPSELVDIGGFAFYNCKSLKSAQLPDKVETIGMRAFAYCSNLNDVSFPDSLTYIGTDALFYSGYFNNSSNWTHDVLYVGNALIHADYNFSGVCNIKEGTRIIAQHAFDQRKKVTEIHIPDSVTHINYGAFRITDSLHTINIPDSVTNIDANILEDSLYIQTEENWTDGALYVNNHLISTNEFLPLEYEIKPGTKTIAADAFSGASSFIEKVTVPPSIKNLSGNTFYNCANLKEVILTEGIESIDSYAFYNCPSLTSVVLPDSLTTLSSYAFENCDALTKVTIPPNVETIPSNAFHNCNKLLQIHIPASVKCIGIAPFDTSAAIYYYGTKKEWNSIDIETPFLNRTIYYNQDLTIGDFNHKITDYTFSGNNLNLEITTSNNGSTAFYTCISVAHYSSDGILKGIRKNTFWSFSGNNNTFKPTITSLSEGDTLKLFSFYTTDYRRPYSYLKPLTPSREYIIKNGKVSQI